MIVSFFRHNYQTEIFAILLVGIILWLSDFNMTSPSLPSLDMAPLSSPLFTLRHNWLTSIVALLLVLAESFMISSITGRFKILRLTNLLPSLIYLLLMSFHREFLTLTPPLFSNFFIILLLYHLFDLYSKHEPLLFIFNASFITGIAALIIPENIILLLLIWISFVIYRSYSFREWAISLSGIIVVLIFTASYYYLTDNYQVFLDSYASYFAQLKAGYPVISPEHIPFIVVLGFFTIITVPRMVIKLDENIIRSRKRLNIIIFLVLISLAALFINPRYWEYHIYMLFIPLSITMARLIDNIKKERNKDWALLLIILAIVIERIL
ncbi:MAG: DUF6427 family protein [Bacteroidales bacterium]|nr:DUF6427 family protein [Bacteroidales bacterium]